MLLEIGSNTLVLGFALLELILHTLYLGEQILVLRPCVGGLALRGLITLDLHRLELASELLDLVRQVYGLHPVALRRALRLLPRFALRIKLLLGGLQGCLCFLVAVGKVCPVLAGPYRTRFEEFVTVEVFTAFYWVEGKGSGRERGLI